MRKGHRGEYVTMMIRGGASTQSGGDVDRLTDAKGLDEEEGVTLSKGSSAAHITQICKAPNQGLYNLGLSKVYCPVELLRSNGLKRRLVQYVVLGKNKLKCKC